MEKNQHVYTLRNYASYMWSDYFGLEDIRTAEFVSYFNMLSLFLRNVVRTIMDSYFISCVCSCLCHFAMKNIGGVMPLISEHYKYVLLTH